jgi:LPXTG-motif cell wall-anchored protein
MMRIGFGGVVVAAGMIAMSTGAAAVDDVVFTASGIVSGGEGEIRLLGEVTVAPELVGATCTGRAETANQDSVHPNNDMIITTGTTQAEIPDFESAPFKLTPLTGTVVLGPTVRFEVRLGPTFVSSGGVVVTLDCTAVGPPTTPAPPTTPPPDPPTTPAPVAPPTTIGQSAGPSPTTVAPAPTTAGASVAGAGALPETGSSSGPAIFAATALILAGVAMTLLRRRTAA